MTLIQDRIHSSFQKQAAMQLIGAELGDIEPGAVTIHLPFRADLTQQHGFIHAGIITMIADSACGYAALSLMPPQAAVLSVEFKINLLSPAIGERLIARGRVLKPGKTLMICQGDVFAKNGDNEKLVATMLGTMIVRQDTGLSD